MAEQRNAGRRVISQADADAIAAKSGVQKPGASDKPKGSGINRREVLAIAMAGSTALLTAGSLLFITAPDPAADPLLGPLLKFTASENPDTLERTYPVAGRRNHPAGRRRGWPAQHQRNHGDLPGLRAPGLSGALHFLGEAFYLPVPRLDLRARYAVCARPGPA